MNAARELWYPNLDHHSLCPSGQHTLVSVWYPWGLIDIERVVNFHTLASPPEFEKGITYPMF